MSDLKRNQTPRQTSPRINQKKVRALTLALGCFASSLHAQLRYTALDLGSLGGSSGTFAAALNNAGTVVGGSGTPDGNSKAFVYRNGHLSELPIPRLAGYAGAAGINDLGVIVGSGYVDPNTYAQPYEAFIYDNGAITMMATSGGTTGAGGINRFGTVVGGFALDYSNFHWNALLATNGVVSPLGTIDSAWVSYGLAINDAGTAVGYYSDPNTNQRQHAFAYSNGTMIALGKLPGGSYSSANAINNAGIIVGYSTTFSGDQHACLFRGGTVSDLGTLGGGIAIAEGINSDGAIVGQSSTANASQGKRAFIYLNGAMTDLNATLFQAIPTVLIDAPAINDFGQIVANGSNLHAYLLSPVATNVPNLPTIDSQPDPVAVQARRCDILGTARTRLHTAIKYESRHLVAPYRRRIR